MTFNCGVLDVVEVGVGDKTRVGPGVQILAADHPRDAATRASGLEFGRPIRIGRNVWVGGGAIILPGVTIGDDALIGAGAVVTRDVPAGATVVGAAATETIAALVPRVQAGDRIDRVSSTVTAYPTYAEAPARAADEHLRRRFAKPAYRALARPVLPARRRWR